MERVKSWVRKQIKELFYALLIGIPLALILKFFVVEIVHVKGQSMEPNFHDRDTVMMDKISYDFHQPRIGDVVIIPEGNMFIIKRVEGLPGDTIEVKDGYLYRNDQKIEESYIKEKMNENFKKMTVPQGDIFAMGDNRNNSSDSRYFGPFPIKTIQGRVFFDFNGHGIVKNPVTP